jgi:hypothetical protein
VQFYRKVYVSNLNNVNGKEYLLLIIFVVKAIEGLNQQNSTVYERLL